MLQFPITSEELPILIETLIPAMPPLDQDCIQFVLNRHPTQTEIQKSYGLKKEAFLEAVQIALDKMRERLALHGIESFDDVQS